MNECNTKKGKSLWLKYFFLSEVENVKGIIDNLTNIITAEFQDSFKKDSEELNSSSNEDKCENYFLIQQLYNPLYAGLLLCIYKSLEYDSKKLLNLTDFKWDCVKCQLLKYNINTKGLIGFNGVNKLRLYCNAYKHNNGCYTRELIKELPEDLKNIVKENDEIDYTRLDVKEMYNEVSSFIYDLYEKIYEKKSDHP